MGGQTEEKKPSKHICAGLLAHVDAGKTTLSEAILYMTGRIRKLGRVDNRDAFLDTYELERARGITIFSKQAVFPLGELAVTLLDTPGHVDFSAEMERTLQVLDYAVLIISGADGVQGHTETLWRLLKRYGIPTFFFVNKMDQPGTDRERILKDLQKRLDGAIVDFSGFLAGEDGQVLENGAGGGASRGGGSSSGSPQSGSPQSGEPQGGASLEDLAMCSEELLETYLETGEVETLAVRQAIRDRKLFPCYFGSALKLTGVGEFLKGLEDFASGPDYPAEFGARVFKISRDEAGTRLTHLKLTGGSLKVREFLDGKEEKVNQIRLYSGQKYEALSEAEAGSVVAVAGPVSTRPGQAFGWEAEGGLPLLEPVLTYQVVLPPGMDAHTALKNMRLLEEEDPQLHIVWNEALGEIQAQVMGDVQMEILKSQAMERFGMDIGFGSGRIVYKETIARTVEGVGHFEPLRHYAEVHLLMEPGEPGSGLVFAADCSEDVLDRNWQRLILTHLEEKRHRGVLTGSEITDMKLTLIAGRAHLKHTEGGDFRQATYRAVRQGLKEAGCRLLEPYYQFRLEVPAEFLGRAMADVDKFQGKFDAPVQENGTAVLTGKAPVVTMRDYQREVVSYTKGRGRLSLSLSGYEPCHNEEEAVAAMGYDFDLDLQDPAGSVFCSHGAGFVVPWDEVKRHMHVESPLAKKEAAKRREAEAAGNGSRLAGGNGTAGPGGSGGLAETLPSERGGQASKAPRLSASYYEDKELEAIFVRTYGERKRPNFTESGDSRRIIRARKETVKPERVQEEEPEEEYLLVDGYNIIFAWDELNELAAANIDGARYKLMDILCNYQGYKKCILIVVFDAYKVVGNPGEALKYHNIHVVYTKEAETADQYIEKLAHKIGRRTRVTVATSDGLEQLIIRGQGCQLLSARDFKEEIERVGRLIAEEKGKYTGGGKNYLFSHADEETRKYLERVRLGKTDEDGAGKKTAGTPGKKGNA